MYFLGLDVGSSSVKAALVESESGKSVLSVHEPKNEMSISSIKNDWAEQDPNLWWEYTCLAIKIVCKESNVDPKKIISTDDVKVLEVWQGHLNQFQGFRSAVKSLRKYY